MGSFYLCLHHRKGWDVAHSNDSGTGGGVVLKVHGKTRCTRTWVRPNVRYNENVYRYWDSTKSKVLLASDVVHDAHAMVHEFIADFRTQTTGHSKVPISRVSLP